MQISVSDASVRHKAASDPTNAAAGRNTSRAHRPRIHQCRCRTFMHADQPDVIRLHNGIMSGQFRDMILVKDPKASAARLRGNYAAALCGCLLPPLSPPTATLSVARGTTPLTRSTRARTTTSTTSKCR